MKRSRSVKNRRINNREGDAKRPTSRSPSLHTVCIMTNEKQDGPEAGQDLRKTVPRQNLEPSDSEDISDEDINKLFSKIKQLETKIESLEEEIDTIKLYQKNGWSR